MLSPTRRSLAPIVLAIYTHQPREHAEARSDIVARAAKLALAALGLWSD
jgi:hypothetical protein